MRGAGLVLRGGGGGRGGEAGLGWGRLGGEAGGGSMEGPGLSVARIALGCGNFGGVGSAPAFFGQALTEDPAFELMDAASAAGIGWVAPAGASRRAPHPRARPRR